MDVNPGLKGSGHFVLYEQDEGRELQKLSLPSGCSQEAQSPHLAIRGLDAKQSRPIASDNADSSVRRKVHLPKINCAVGPNICLGARISTAKKSAAKILYPKLPLP